MPWPPYVLEAFEAIPGGINGATDESLFYGPYNTLLGFLFPPTDHYMITPQFKRPPEGWSIDFTTVFIVRKAFHPVFFIEIKPPADHARRSSRAAADGQMRTCFFDLVDAVQLPVLYGVSALGTRLCFYSYQSNDDALSPIRIDAKPLLMKDVTPADWWNIDLLSDEGVIKLTEVVNDVKAMVARHYGVRFAQKYTPPIFKCRDPRYFRERSPPIFQEALPPDISGSASPIFQARSLRYYHCKIEIYDKSPAMSSGVKASYGQTLTIFSSVEILGRPEIYKKKLYY
ncbi:hypothetical protein M422DRAFT_25682 [Sphaerobolus stellatus SS14]|nr:hypothetical protein M422DRAFT_25682 [Sphaerobolus stellatus SS14]